MIIKIRIILVDRNTSTKLLFNIFLSNKPFFNKINYLLIQGHECAGGDGKQVHERDPELLGSRTRHEVEKTVQHDAGNRRNTETASHCGGLIQSHDEVGKGMGHVVPGRLNQGIHVLGRVGI